MPWSERRARLNDARLYFISDATPGGRPLADVLPAALRGGVDLFQLRMKDATDDEILETAQTARAACDVAGALFILNDRPDLAAAAHADGAHVGQDDMMLEAARAALDDPDLLLGRSTHTPEQIAAAASADYIGVGPLNATPTKPGRAPVGLALVRAAAQMARMPFFAIGGIDTTTIDAALTAGATRVAVVRAIAQAADPELAARTLRAHLTNAEATTVGAR